MNALVPKHLLRTQLALAERFVFSPGILELNTNCTPIYGFVYGIAPGWTGSESLPQSRVALEWRVMDDDATLYPAEDGLVRYEGRKLPGGAIARMALRWDANRPRLVCNAEYLFWSALRGTASHQLPGTILSDAATAALLSNGLAPVHCSAVEKDGAGIVLIAPSNTGKTTTAWRLVSQHGFSFMAEDIAIVDGRHLHGASYTGTGLPKPFPLERIPMRERIRRMAFPVWLKQSLAEQLRADQIHKSAPIDHIVFLERGKVGITNVNRVEAGDLLLRNNRLEFRYLGSPHLVQSWYNGRGPDLDWAANEEKRLLNLLVSNARRVVRVSAPESESFSVGILQLLGA